MGKKMIYPGILVFIFCCAFTICGCAKEEAVTPEKSVQAEKTAETSAPVEFIVAEEDEVLMYLPVTAAEASSFDQTPDWAPEPNPMAPVDGDMFTRWSSDYTEGEQWISFDLGTPSVVSNTIIRWERAYATVYKILVSNDNVNWEEVYIETNGATGAREASFNPVKCRYVKILSTERVNDDWGISIWETEIYGPAAQNPQATVTKESYLGKGEDEAQKEKARELIKEFAGNVVPMSEKEFQKGVVYTSWMSDELALPVSDITLVGLKQIGIDTVGIMVPAYQEALDSEVIFTNDVPDGDTPTIEALKHAVDTCHALGMRVMIKPHVDPRTDEARINIMPSEKWFDSYEEFILRYARFAQENNVEIFAIGTELEATTFESWTHRWVQVIDKVRAEYKGLLTYAANWTEYKEVPFWDKMDLIGIDAYFPLTGIANPTVEELVAAWNVKADEMENWLGEKGLTDKGIILTEIGYPSADGANRQPWVAISSIEDQQEQADCLEATFEVLTKRPWFKGYYLWQYFPQERWSPLGFTIKGKKSEEIVKKWLVTAE
ncbi:MAG: discoidin domain-containing protein [Candidatus Omnitrophota bacterium]